jgi:dCTP deaminase
MILTGPYIEDCIREGEIVVDPYDPKLVGPNSVDLRLHKDLKIYSELPPHRGRPGAMRGPPTEHHPLDMKTSFSTRTMEIPEQGFLLKPNVLYLGRTIERVGSKAFVPMVEGRSSCGRLGLQVHMTAGFCDTGFEGTITLEMTVVHPLRIYPNVPICQVFFLRPEGKIRLYEGRYQGHVEPTASRMHLASEGAGRKVVDAD